MAGLCRLWSSIESIGGSRYEHYQHLLLREENIWDSICFSMSTKQYERVFFSRNSTSYIWSLSCNAHQSLYTHLIGILAGLYVLRSLYHLRDTCYVAQELEK